MMTRNQLAFWALFAVTMGVYATMLLWSLPAISAAAGGLVPFDMRPGGYHPSEARAFLAALSPDGAAFYRDVQHRLDIAYPALLAATLFFAFTALIPPRLGAWRWFVALPVWIIAGFDYAENAAVAAMIEAGAAGTTDEMVRGASRWTVLKSSATIVAMTILLALLGWRAMAWLRRR
jgi:hypothetical protein